VALLHNVYTNVTFYMLV